MQIIIVPNETSSSSRRIIIDTKWYLKLIMIVLTAFFIFHYLLEGITFLAPKSTQILHPFQSSSELSHQEKVAMNAQISLLGQKIGQMQGQLMQMDSLGERVSGLAGIPANTYQFHVIPGQGGALPSTEDNLSLEEFNELIAQLERAVTQRTDYMNTVETTLVDKQFRNNVFTTIYPVKSVNITSRFGYRFDPFNGGPTMHQGVDFSGSIGTPILSVARGKVVQAHYHNQYGNMVEVDHGNNIITRYAHASRLNVRVGDIVNVGDILSFIGSTGRSTGPHLHFEVLVNNVRQNPEKFLNATIAKNTYP